MREEEEDGMVEINYLPMKEMLADGLIKLLNGVSFATFRELIGIISQA